MLTYYRAGRLVAKIFIKLAWAILIVFGLLLTVVLIMLAMEGSGTAGMVMRAVPPLVVGVLPLAFVCMATTLFGHVALAVFDMADAARKTD